MGNIEFIEDINFEISENEISILEFIYNNIQKGIYEIDVKDVCWTLKLMGLPETFCSLHNLKYGKIFGKHEDMEIVDFDFDGIYTIHFCKEKNKNLFNNIKSLKKYIKQEAINEKKMVLNNIVNVCFVLNYDSNKNFFADVSFSVDNVSIFIDCNGEYFCYKLSVTNTMREIETVYEKILDIGGKDEK